MSDFEIKILDANDAADFRSIRLSALAKAPAMFGSSYALEAAKPLSFFESCLANAKVFAAFQGQKIIGLAVFSQEQSTKLSHKAQLSSVFVEPEYQQQGVAGQLLQAVINYSKMHVEQILLTVAADNAPAVHLYKNFGFQLYGIEAKALKDTDRYIDEILMKLFLARI
ncbi:GNAT family N-acetyltransferase [Acinetobacter tianfuensis]|uniref:GNAT family N-acetyltransferase n=1 Tax=Acinetobacter tianfuensis TaxID=2419603 RepID=A0A3A8ENB0_9GAMM|nr:GNAT family N-acetyltransferase [Acinetobacter tianfuensis]RKG30341.1 GNAT family N-acetyltransferase [Acinetobacter tianfuensis]